MQYHCIGARVYVRHGVRGRCRERWRTLCEGQGLANGIAARNERGRSGQIEGSTAFKVRAYRIIMPQRYRTHSARSCDKPEAEESREPVARVERPHTFTCRNPSASPLGGLSVCPLSRLVRAHYAAMCQQPIVIFRKNSGLSPLKWCKELFNIISHYDIPAT